MLELKNVTKSFGEKQIFKDFSHSFNTGIYIIKGTSGIGKTTLLRMISGLDTNFDGEISGGGIQNVSLSFQEYRLFEHLNAIENVNYSFFHSLRDLQRGICTAVFVMNERYDQACVCDHPFVAL